MLHFVCTAVTAPALDVSRSVAEVARDDKPGVHAADEATLASLQDVGHRGGDAEASQGIPVVRNDERPGPRPGDSTREIAKTCSNKILQIVSRGWHPLS
jgi:hypothetical protein